MLRSLIVIVLGGVLANPAKTMPNMFGDGAIVGFQWMKDYPYALPSLVNAFSLMFCTVRVHAVQSWSNNDTTHQVHSVADIWCHSGARGVLTNE